MSEEIKNTNVPDTTEIADDELQQVSGGHVYYNPDDGRWYGVDILTGKAVWYYESKEHAMSMNTAILRDSNMERFRNYYHLTKEEQFGGAIPYPYK